MVLINYVCFFIRIFQGTHLKLAFDYTYIYIYKYIYVYILYIYICTIFPSGEKNKKIPGLESGPR